MFVRILKRDTQWLLDFGYKIVIPWLLRGISEQKAVTLGLHPRDTGVLFSYAPSTHGITITYVYVIARVGVKFGINFTSVRKFHN